MGGGRLGALCLVALGGAFLLIASLLAVEVAYIGPESIARVLSDPEIRHAIYLSLATSTLAALLALFLALPASYALARIPFKGRWLVDLMIDLPIVLSPVAVGVCLLLLFRTSPGRFVEENFLRFVFEVPGIILAQFIVSLALAIRVMKAAFEEVDVRLEQVARFLGSTPFAAFRRVTLPLASRGVLAAFILAWARALGEFGATVTLAGAVAGKTETIPVAIHLRLSMVDIDGAVALMVVLTLTSFMALVGIRIVGRRF